MMCTSCSQKKILPGWQYKYPVLVLLSGGIDSAALLGFYRLNDVEVRPLFVDYGQPARKQELLAAKALCKHYGVKLSVMTVRTFANFSVGEIPGRNAFLVLAAVLGFNMRSGIIAIGIHEGAPYYDCTEGFLKSIQTILDGYSAGRIKVVAPFLTWRKQDIWEFCRKIRVPVELTYSCEKGGARPCGMCSSCKDREALNAL